ncbi:MAG: 16S rRNA (guanine(527)-N(7))-methyltransferase RsmG [Treponema sp.]|nr:16S rRNA (guanine(527)-N(7))-methyltransferase RsmG [Treponema sp.]
MSILQEGLTQLGLSPLEEKMDAYIRTLQEYNAKFDLINTDEYDQIAIRHIFDSLSGAAEIAKLIEKRIACTAASSANENGLVLADIGSGAGLPGIPLAAAFPERKFVLVERMTKRVDFLRHCAEVLQLDNVTVEENQAERLEQRRFDIAVFRAFRPLEKKMTKVLLRILKDGGYLAAYKAKCEKITEEMQSLPVVPAYEVVPLTVPFLTEHTGAEEERERNLVIISKN